METSTLTAAPVYFTVEEVRAMLDGPETWTHTPDGGVQVERAGVVGFGSTLAAATADWSRTFAQMICRP
jgi:hypothetical protein